MADLIIRVVYRSGAVSEDRGTREQLDRLLQLDAVLGDQRRIDHAQLLDPTTGRSWVVALTTHPSP